MFNKHITQDPRKNNNIQPLYTENSRNLLLKTMENNLQNTMMFLWWRHNCTTTVLACDIKTQFSIFDFVPKFLFLACLIW